jgi:hypothetical protein
LARKMLGGYPRDPPNSRGYAPDSFRHSGEATHRTATIRQHQFGFARILLLPVGFG